METMLICRFLFSIVGACLAVQVWAGSYDQFFTAIRHDRSDTIQELLDRGFDPNTVNNKGIPALVLAAQNESWKCVSVLVQAKHIKLNVTNQNDENALMLAAINNQVDIAQMLIQKGADVNKQGWNALHYASSKGHIQMMRLLLENDAYMDAESPNGTTPLMMAAHYGTAPAVKLLLEEGADPRIKNKLGLSAMEFANQSLQPQTQAQDSKNYLQAFLSAWKQRYPDTPINSTKSE
jgi:ankyrin repeat protein